MYIKNIADCVKVVPQCYLRCPDIHDLSECHHMYDLGRQMFLH